MSKHAEPPRAEEGPTDADRATVTGRPEPRSRQSLVVKPRSSNGPFLVIGAIASAVAGFGLVFMTGLGRSHPLAVMPDIAGIESVPGEGTAPTEPPSDIVASPPSTPRFFSPAGATAAAPVEEAGRSRFAAQPVGLETGDEPTSPKRASSGSSTFAASGPPQRPSRGESTDEAADDAVDESEGVSDAETPEAEPVVASPVVPDRPEQVVADTNGQADATLVAAAPSVAVANPSGERPISQESPPPRESAAGEPAAPSSEPAVTAGPQPPGLRQPPLESTFAAALAPKQPEPPRPAGMPQPASSTAIDDPGAPIPVTPPGGRPQPPAAVGASSDVPPVARPRGERVASADVTRGFGAAPPLVPPVEQTSPDATAPALAAAAGLGPLKPDGRPGPIQLEGVQTPQLTIEKRGPREVQVGKVARYEMAVRNVGAVSAHDVTLRDRVPLGTKLISTSPPATPGESGELVWTLGTLPQATQARVTMEVMPVEEGEVGSVASVSFRADASVRSVATRAAIAIEVTEAKPVLVGSTVDLAITVRNPGTGEATGVVLEGTLPTGFRHAAGAELEFDVGRLRPGESRRVDLKLASTHPGVQKLRLTARADGRIETERDVRLEVTAPTLELTADMPNRRYLQRPVTCVLSMNNAGTAPANTIDLAAQLPPGMKFVRANNAGHYEESTHRVLWHLEQLPAAEVGSVEMVLVPTALGPQRIAAAARSSDGLTAQVDHTVEVEGLAALLFEVGDSEDPIEVDGITEYVVRVGNQGTKAATGVRVTATLLGDLEPVDAKGPSAHRVENLSIRFDPVAKLAPAGEAVYRIRVRGRREGDQRVQVQVTSDDSQAPITKEEVTRVYSDR